MDEGGPADGADGGAAGAVGAVPVHGAEGGNGCVQHEGVVVICDPERERGL